MGDVIDARDETMGAWFEAKILQIIRANNRGSEQEKQPDDKKQEGSSVDDAKEAKGESSSGGIGTDDKLSTNDGDDGYLYRIVFEK
jgi:hypothetical protein